MTGKEQYIGTQRVDLTGEAVTLTPPDNLLDGNKPDGCLIQVFPSALGGDSANGNFDGSTPCANWNSTAQGVGCAPGLGNGFVLTQGQTLELLGSTMFQSLFCAYNEEESPFMIVQYYYLGLSNRFQN